MSLAVPFCKPYGINVTIIWARRCRTSPPGVVAGASNKLASLRYGERALMWEEFRFIFVCVVGSYKFVLVCARHVNVTSVVYTRTRAVSS